MISILVPTLGRADRLRAVARNALEATKSDCEVVFIVEQTDQPSIDVARGCSWDLAVRCLINQRAPNYAGAINTGYQHTSGEWLFAGADDLCFHDDWDAAALGDPAPVLGTNDLLNPYVAQGTHATHYLVHRHYLDDTGGVIDQGPGVFLNEAYDHQYTDAEFIDTARYRGVFNFRRESIVEHLHFLADASRMDATYERAYAHAAADAQTYKSRLPLWGNVSNHLADLP